MCYGPESYEKYANFSLPAAVRRSERTRYVMAKIFCGTLYWVKIDLELRFFIIQNSEVQNFVPNYPPVSFYHSYCEYYQNHFRSREVCLLPKGYCLQSNYMTEEEWLSLFGSKTKSFLFWDWDSTDAVEQDSRILMDAVSSLLLFW